MSIFMIEEQFKESLSIKSRLQWWFGIDLVGKGFNMKIMTFKSSLFNKDMEFFKILMAMLFG